MYLYLSCCLHFLCYKFRVSINSLVSLVATTYTYLVCVIKKYREDFSSVLYLKKAGGVGGEGGIWLAFCLLYFLVKEEGGYAVTLSGGCDKCVEDDS